MITLILGGARSGKSDLALRLAGTIPGRRAFVATAQVLDEEMAERITLHRRTRGDDWETFEEPREVGQLLLRIAGQFQVILLDCLTLWISNRLLAGGAEGIEAALEKEIDLIREAGKYPGLHLFLVGNEVGMGVVPESSLGRIFRDLCGRVHQSLAKAADSVTFCVAGLPLPLKGEGAPSGVSPIPQEPWIL